MLQASAGSGPVTAKSQSAARTYFALFVAYVAFAAIVYVVHGPQPELSIDHIAYFKQADEIRAQYINGDYWRSFNSVRSYGVILAYLFGVTGSHIESLKLLLAGMTVAYLAAFQIFMSLATSSRGTAAFFSILSALFVSFGASIWGVTDFSASLNRTIVVPFVILVLWFFFRHPNSPLRYAAFPVLVVLSLLHLSALHVFLVLLLFDGLDFMIRRRFRIDRNVAFLVLALVVSMGLRESIERLGIGGTRFVDATVKIALQTPAAPVVAQAPSTQSTVGPAPAVGAARNALPNRLTAQESWDIELMAFPWRNLPPSVATLVNMALSFGVILILSIWGIVGVFRSGVITILDRVMLMFAGAVLIGAYGLQLVLWVLRSVTSIYPVNFEEIRAINLLMIPAVYFVFRLWESAPSFSGMPTTALRVAIVTAFVLQPILIIRSLPVEWREGIVSYASDYGWLRREDSVRLLYARQYLGLGHEGPRFYYSAQAAIEWLRRNADPADRVLTDRNEVRMAGLKAVGPFLEMLDIGVTDPARIKWAAQTEAVARALASRNTDAVITLARHYHATYAIVPWAVKDAAYQDNYLSVIRVN